MEIKRLYFIDALRAFAILMMLQGHFIDTLLDPIYKSETLTVYTIWKYFRGITAPTFFTISGLIFTYLLLKSKDDIERYKRIKKGCIRGAVLIGIGYLLRLNYFDIMSGNFKASFLVVDVLQCIGFALIGIIIIYLLTLKESLIFSIVMLIIGCVIFVLEPTYRHLNFESTPLIIANYFTKQYGSVFTLLPWFGYVALGSFIATLFHTFLHTKLFKLITICLLISIGFWLIFYSSNMLMVIYNKSDHIVFKQAAYYNYLFTRFGNVCLLIAFFYGFETVFNYHVFLKIGQKTLSIYIIHFILIYGSFTGFGLHQIIGNTLSPIQAIFGALLFLVTVCVIAFYYVKTNTILYRLIRKIWVL